MVIIRGILINKKIHTGKDLELIMTSKDLTPPNVQSQKIEIPGRNGVLDMSEYLTNDVVFNNRILKFSFFTDGPRSKILNLIDTMLGYHGQYVTVTVDDDTNWYYEGRGEVSYSDKYYYAEFELTIDAQPFKKAIVDKVYTFTNVTNFSANLRNEGRRVLPLIEVTEETTIVQGEYTYTLSKGVYNSEELLINNGLNSWIITTTGTITITYKEVKI